MTGNDITPRATSARVRAQRHQCGAGGWDQPMRGPAQVCHDWLYCLGPMVSALRPSLFVTLLALSREFPVVRWVQLPSTALLEMLDKCPCMLAHFCLVPQGCSHHDGPAEISQVQAGPQAEYISDGCWRASQKGGGRISTVFHRPHLGSMGTALDGKTTHLSHFFPLRPPWSDVAWNLPWLWFQKLIETKHFSQWFLLSNGKDFCLLHCFKIKRNPS